MDYFKKKIYMTYHKIWPIINMVNVISIWPIISIELSAELRLEDEASPELNQVSNTSSGGTPNLHFPHLHQTQIYTNPKFTQDPNLHKPRFTRDPYLHSPDLHKSIFAHRFQETQVYTNQIYTKPKFTQKISSNFAQTISSEFNPG